MACMPLVSISVTAATKNLQITKMQKDSIDEKADRVLVYLRDISTMRNSIVGRSLALTRSSSSVNHLSILKMIRNMH